MKLMPCSSAHHRKATVCSYTEGILPTWCSSPLSRKALGISASPLENRDVERMFVKLFLPLFCGLPFMFLDLIRFPFLGLPESQKHIYSCVRMQQS